MRFLALYDLTNPLVYRKGLKHVSRVPFAVTRNFVKFNGTTFRLRFVPTRLAFSRKYTSGYARVYGFSVCALPQASLKIR